jgi:membrane protein required for beta-lactamase induction
MSFLALLLGLAVERVLTHLFRLREFRWLDPVFDAVFRRLGSARPAIAFAGLLLLIAVLAAPVAITAALLWDELLRIPYFLFAVLVLLFSLGPRDLDDEVEDYLGALQAGDEELQQRVAREILEREPPALAGARSESVERAIYLQANNRIFGVVFWFLLLGPGGAWTFRVADLMRRRMEFQLSRPEPGVQGASAGEVRRLHAMVAWIPSRLLATGYVLAGNFEDAASAWRDARVAGLSLAEGTSLIVTRIGIAATGGMSGDLADPANAMERIRAARGIVMRTLWMIWCPVVAIMTLYDWVT